MKIKESLVAAVMLFLYIAVARERENDLFHETVAHFCCCLPRYEVMARWNRQITQTF